MGSSVWTRIDTLATHDAVFVAPGTPLRQVADLMAERSIGAVLVGDSHHLLGIVSERDLVAAAATGADFDRAIAAGAMSADVVCLRPADRLYDAAVDMLDLGIRHVPVVDERGTVEGIVSIRDLIRPLLVRSLEG